MRSAYIVVKVTTTLMNYKALNIKKTCCTLNVI